MPLLEKLYQMQQNRVATDCCFQFSDSLSVSNSNINLSDNSIKIYAHKLIWSAASIVFRNMIGNNWRLDGSHTAFESLINTKKNEQARACQKREINLYYARQTFE